MEPGNRQAQVPFNFFLFIFLPFVLFDVQFSGQELEALVSKRLEKDGMVGMAVAGGAALAVGGQMLKIYRHSIDNISSVLLDSAKNVFPLAGLVGLGLAFAGRQAMKK